MRTRLTTRHLLLAVGIAALLLAAGREWRLVREHERCRLSERFCRERIAERLGERAYCLGQARLGAPYDAIGRQGANDHLYPSLAPEFRDWDDEAADHAAWAKTYVRALEIEAGRRRRIERLSLIR
jgi:hypothetical protein